MTTLKDFFARHPRTALGFSGGTDSAYLLYAGTSLGADVRPYYIKTQFQPAFELEDARRLADELGVELTVIEADILADDAVAANPPDRCYHCKRALFTLLAERAASDGYSELIDGTNASDDPGDRPSSLSARVRHHQGRRAPPLAGGGALHVCQALLRLPRHARADGPEDRGGGAGQDRGGGERAEGAGL